MKTQGKTNTSEKYRLAVQKEENGWLGNVKELYDERAPGLTCLAALQDSRMGSMEKPLNDSKGCGGVMRMAPVGLVVESPPMAFKMGCEFAALTHGHPTGYLAAGCFAALICSLRERRTLKVALDNSISLLMKMNNSRECVRLLTLAQDLSRKAARRMEWLP